MFFYVASFPRSGSALTRTILWQCFGLHVNQVGQLSKKPKLEGTAGADMSDILGPRGFPLGTTEAEMIAAAAKTDGPILLKTHALPDKLAQPEAPALVIVRDGRPVMASYTRFRNEVAGRGTDLATIIKGRPRNWSEHVDAWLDRDGPQLLLRYEDLRVAKQESLDAIAGFLGCPQVAPFTTTVEEIRAIRPTHIQVARNEPGIEEIERGHAALFWRLHGKAMERLGYAR